MALCGALAAGLWLPASVAAQMHMPSMPGATPPLDLPENRLGSGTSWLPDATPMHAIHVPLGAWTLMVHGTAAFVFDAQGGARGATAVQLLNWGMGSVTRDALGGWLQLRAMVSAEPATVGADGYPLLLQSGESNHGIALHDRQHPHDLFMETALQYDRAIGRSLALSLYLAPAGEPALGPPAYPHRPSAGWDPLAPIGHHWQDGTHVTYGVVTGGVYTRTYKIEGSVFNGREPDETRTNFDFRGRRLDSYAGRASLNPSPGLSISAWYGYLRSPEALEPSTSLHRLGAAVLVTRRRHQAGWSAALVYGANMPQGASRWSTSVLLEGSADLDPANTLFGRVEYVQKTAADLVLPSATTGLFDVEEVSLGLFRALRRTKDIVLGVGARGTVNMVPASLRDAYGSRLPLGVAVFLSLRPGGVEPHRARHME